MEIKSSSNVGTKDPIVLSPNIISHSRSLRRVNQLKAAGCSPHPKNPEHSMNPEKWEFLLVL